MLSLKHKLCCLSLGTQQPDIIVLDISNPTHAINISHLPAGIYSAELQHGGSTIVRKLSIQ